MASKVFDDLLLQGIRSGKVPAREKDARDWYRNKAQTLTTVTEKRLLSSAGKERLKDPTNFHVGDMYMFAYDPKHKKTLPYYDKFPVIFPIGEARGGFYGINFHYLPYPLRAKLMDALYDVTNNKDYDVTTRLKLSYQILNSASKFHVFAPTLKHYLYPQIRSRLIYVHPSEWDIAIFLPVERFVGASKTEVWKQSKAALRR